MIDILIILSLLVLFLLISKSENFMDYKRCKPIKGITNEVFREHGVNLKKKKEDWGLFMPCGYKNLKNQFKDLNGNDKLVSGITDCDNIVSKKNFWKIIKDYYGRKNASTIMPETFILKDKEDMDLFKNIYDPNESYIMKNQKQRKRGIKISNDLNEISNTNDYFIVQRMIESHKHNGYKYNLRVYLVVVCDNQNIKYYVHDRMKYLYAKNKASDNKLEKDSNITNSYIMDKDIYNNNPRYVEKDGEIYQKVISILKKLKPVLNINLCKENTNNLHFQFFGADIMFDENLNPYILEMNKGPDMKPKDDIDHENKKKVIEDIYGLVNVIDIDNNELVKI